MWRPTAYGEDDFAAFREAMQASPIKAVLIHAVYLLNCASEDPEIRDKSLRLADPVAARRRRDRRRRRRPAPRLGQAGRRRRGDQARRQGDRARRWPRPSGCALHLEDTAGAGGTLGRSFEELAALIEAAGGGTAAGRVPGLLPPARLRLRHPHRRGADRDARRVRRGRRAGRLALAAPQRLADAAGLQPRPARRYSARASSARRGCAAFLSEPRFEELPCVLETGARRQGRPRRSSSASSCASAARRRASAGRRARPASARVACRR